MNDDSLNIILLCRLNMKKVLIINYLHDEKIPVLCSMLMN